MQVPQYTSTPQQVQIQIGLPKQFEQDLTKLHELVTGMIEDMMEIPDQELPPVMSDGIPLFTDPNEKRQMYLAALHQACHVNVNVAGQTALNNFALRQREQKQREATELTVETLDDPSEDPL